MASSISPLTYTQTSQTSSSQNSTSSSNGQIMGVSANEDTFLTLLVTQLKNQDPMSPADSTQFVGELAQFSSLEQLVNINQNVGSMTKIIAPSSSSGSSSDSGTSATSGLS